VPNIGGWYIFYIFETNYYGTRINTDYTVFFQFLEQVRKNKIFTDILWKSVEICLPCLPNETFNHFIGVKSDSYFTRVSEFNLKL